MAKKSQKRWVYSPKAPPTPKVPDAVKQAVQAKCDALTEEKLRPRHVQSPPDAPEFNHIVDLYNL